jgi:hypothetical protein
MSETQTRALRPDAFRPKNRRFTMEFENEPAPTRAEALSPGFWRDLDVKDHDVVHIDCSDGPIDLLIGHEVAGGGRYVRAL